MAGAYLVFHRGGAMQVEKGKPLEKTNLGFRHNI